MNKDIWEIIRKDYDTAKYCLCCPRKGKSSWSRNEDKGMYHLWCSYYLGKEEEEKDNFLYAQILMFMQFELHYLDDYTRFNKYVKPAVKLYKKAIKEGQTIKNYILEDALDTYKSLKYTLEKTSDTPEEWKKAYDLIDGLSNIKGFQFHDSIPLRFEHDRSSAKLLLQFDDIVVRLDFDGLIDVEVHDPTYDWIFDFYCYHAYHDRKIIVFDTDFYIIKCTKIKATDVSESFNLET